jgi:hypothetical protein
MVEIVTVSTEPTAEDVAAQEKHNEEMIAKVDEVSSNQEKSSSDNASPEQEEKPDWLPDNINSVDEFTKSYKELQRKNTELSSQLKNQDPSQDKKEPENTNKASEEEEEEEVDQQTKDKLEKSNIDLKAMSDEYSSNGTLSDDSYAKLDKAGFSKEYVDTYIAGKQALANQAKQEVFSTVGGEEAYSELMVWAKANLPEDEVLAYNSTIDSGNMGNIKLAVTGLKAKFSETKGPNLLGGNAPDNNSGLFRSRAELIKAMSDPRYKTDEAYRKDVERKLDKSNIL